MLIFCLVLSHVFGYYDIAMHFPAQKRDALKMKVKEMFYFGYNNYIDHAFPLDELNPHNCSGRGPDYDDPTNININDILGNYSLGLVDALDTIAVMGDKETFADAVQKVISTVSFDQSTYVQVFESTIRMLGSLLTSHLIITQWSDIFKLNVTGYKGELLDLAQDLGGRLLPAFDNNFGIPYPRVNLRAGKSEHFSQTSCTAGIGTLILEFKILGKLVDDPTFETVAERAMEKLWNLRDKTTGLIGNVLNLEKGTWENSMSGIGAGIDSYYEYLLKSFVLFGDQKDLSRFVAFYDKINLHMKRSYPDLDNETFDSPIYYANVDMKTGKLHNHWMDSLSAAFIGVQILHGDLEAAIKHHALFYGIWLKYDALPERFNWYSKECDYAFYPLRPEFVEATYLLYQATKHPFYLYVGESIYKSLQAHNLAKCGYATLNSVLSKKQEDRMESFFLSETCKYLYLLFDVDNPLNKRSDFIFTTEGHLFKVDSLAREGSGWWDEFSDKGASEPSLNISQLHFCDTFEDSQRVVPPSSDKFWGSLMSLIDLNI